MASRKLRPYFQCHPIIVVTTYPLRNISHKHELSGRLAKWAIELREYEISYQPRFAIKSQVLADFVADFSQGIQLEAEKELQVFNGANPGTWTLFTDGSSNVRGATREARMQQYLEKVRELIKQFQDWKIRQIPKDKNLEADALANFVSAADVANNANASVIHLFHSVLDPDANEYGTIPDDKKKAYALRRQAARYCLKQGNLYLKMFGGPLARCLGPSQTDHCTVAIYEMGNGYRRTITASKRTEAGAFKHVRKKEVRDFIWWNIICRFGVPKEIVCDNGPQFIGAQITEFFQSWQIKRITSTPYHPMGNGQAESTNKVIINNLKKRLEESKGNWTEVLPGVLWAIAQLQKQVQVKHRSRWFMELRL
ncbi:uncharacterized protein [Nicotiana sylvestris]|uniref:uncharacterized protein n=1 Tax=Nicotiana sylvestris TaxID=4096 RepID=UPI00388C5426